MHATVDPRLTGKQIRRLVLEQSKRAHVGHIGSALSIADIIAAVYTGGLRLGALGDLGRDRFILSKGHASLALYSALYLIGLIDRGELNSYCGDGSTVGVHPEHQLPGVDFSTGSLGHGLSIGAGGALAGRMLASDRRVIVLLSDAECNEGSVWEAVMFAKHHELANLVAIVDMNGQQALGYTKDVVDLAPMADRWRVFGWDTHEVDGHDVEGMVQELQALDFASGPPHVILAQTVFGKGVSIMESRIRWHYMPMSDEEYGLAVLEVEAG